MIADSVETVAGCEGFDGMVAIGGRDKNMPGCLIALTRLNRPRCLSMEERSSQLHRQSELDLVSIFEAVGAHSNGKISDVELEQVESCAIPGPVLEKMKPSLGFLQLP